jgi:ABC-type sugar transport system ATPase subunit
VTGSDEAGSGGDGRVTGSDEAGSGGDGRVTGSDAVAIGSDAIATGGEAGDDGDRMANAYMALHDAGEHDAPSRAQALILGLGFKTTELERPVNSFSGGWRMRVMLAKLLLQKPSLLLLDEPTNHLGARQSAEVLEVIKRAKKKGLGVIFISHTLPHVLEVTDRIVVLRLGKIVRDAPTKEYTADTLIGTITGSYSSDE